MDSRISDLKPENKLPTVGEKPGLFVGPNQEVPISGEKISPSVILPKPIPFFIPQGGQGARGDSPDLLGVPMDKNMKLSK